MARQQRGYMLLIYTPHQNLIQTDNPVDQHRSSYIIQIKLTCLTDPPTD